MNKLSILVPSRGRPHRLKEYVRSVYQLSDHPDRVEMLIYIDDDDTSIADYRAFEKTQPADRVKFIYGERIRAPKAWNALAAQSTGDALMMGNDDVIFQTQGWDTLLHKDLAKYPDQIYCAWMNDMDQGEKLSTAPIISRLWYETLGYFVPPFLNHYYTDTWLFDIGKRLDRLHYMPDIIAEHRHPCRLKFKEDATYKEPKAAGFFAKDGQTFTENTAKRKEEAEKLAKLIH